MSLKDNGKRFLQDKEIACRREIKYCDKKIKEFWPAAGVEN